MQRKLGAAGAVLVAAALTLTACGSSGTKATSSTTTGGSGATTTTAVSTGSGSTTTAASGGTFNPTGTLTMESSPESQITANYNPFNTSNPVQQMGATAFIYEPLLMNDPLKNNTYYPWLATSYSFSSDGKTITFQIRPGVKFSDGSSFTAQDAAFTFTMLQKNASVNTAAIPIVSSTATNNSTFVLTLSQPGYTYLFNIANTPIVSQAHWSSVTNPSTYVDANPVGTGGYVPGTFSSNGFTLKARSGYWQAGLPKVGTLSFPAYTSNDTAELALENGTLDWAGNFINNVQQVYVAKDPTHNHYWFPTANTVSLNVNLSKWPTNQLAVRQAISAAINRQVISTDAEDSYEPPATSSSGLVLPLDSSYLTASDTNDLSYNPSKVTSIMTAAGYTKSGGVWSKGGQQVSFSVEDPSAYTDYAAAAQVIATELNTVGFKVTFDGVSPNQWNSDLQAGNYGAAIHWSSSGPSPYYMYENWLDPKLVTSSGANGGNYERYTGSDAATLINQFSNSAPGSAAQTQAIQGLANIVSTQLPVIPIMYGVDWGEYSTKTVTGWPTAQNPYEPAQPSAPFNDYTVMHLTPVS
jgi:peptide/nickel transport system substrate-binding protein